MIVLFSLPALAETQITLGVPDELVKASLECKELLFHRKYDEAFARFDELAKKFPESPTGVAGKMAIWQLRMYENEDFRFQRQYKEAEKAYDSFALKQLRAGNVPTWDLFIYGAVDGMRSFFESRTNSWWKALTSATHAVRMLKQARWNDPSFIDPDMGIGTYLYWRSVYTKEINFLPFFSDQRKNGISMIENVLTNGKYAKDLAQGNLIFIYRNEHQLDKAAAIADTILAQYPENLIIRFARGQIANEARKYDEALKLLDQVLKQDPAIKKVYYFKGQAYFGKKDLSEAKKYFDLFLQNETDKEWLAAAHFFLGWIAENQNDKATATTEYETALKLNPKQKSAKQRLGLLTTKKK